MHILRPSHNLEAYMTARGQEYLDRTPVIREIVSKDENLLNRLRSAFRTVLDSQNSEMLGRKIGIDLPNGIINLGFGTENITLGVGKIINPADESLIPIQVKIHHAFPFPEDQGRFLG